MSKQIWQTLKPLECSKFAAPCLLKNDYIIISTNDNKGSIYAYSLKQEKLLNIYKLGIEPCKHSIIVDNKHSKIYIYTNSGQSSDIFFEVDIKNKSCKTYKGLLHGVPEGITNETGGDIQLCIMDPDNNNIIHAIGGHSKSYHLIWINNNNQSQNNLYSFSSKPIGNRKPDEPLYGHSLIVLNSLKQILILGGKSSTIWGGYLNDIWVCQCRSPHKVDDIKWTKLNNTFMPHKMEGFACIKTNDEKWIIIFGGRTSTGLKDEIWILSTVTWTWTKLKTIKCPKKSKYYAVITKSDHIHLFPQEQDKHYKITLNQLLDDLGNSMEPQTGNNYKNGNGVKVDFEDTKEGYTEITTGSTSDGIPNITRSRRKSVTLHNDKHYEDTIKQLKMLNNGLTEQVVDLGNKLEKMEKKCKCLEDKYNDLEMKYDEMIQKDKQRIFSDVSNYKNWSFKDIIHWISYLENGRFEKYLKMLQHNLKVEKIGGEYLIDLDKHDIHRLGVTEYGDKKALLNHFHSLRNIDNNDDKQSNECSWNENALFAHIVM